LRGGLCASGQKQQAGEHGTDAARENAIGHD